MNIFVSNLSFDITSEQLQTEFESFGTVSMISIVGNRETGGDSSIAFVEMKNDTEARSAIEHLNRKNIAGYQITVIDLRHKSSRKERKKHRPKQGSLLSWDKLFKTNTRKHNNE
jgi:RNA recognition motif-containing protein